VCQGLCRFLGVEFGPQMLECGSRHQRYRGMPHHQRLFQPISTSRIGVYRDEVPWATQQLYCRQAQEALEVFGYLKGDGENPHD